MRFTRSKKTALALTSAAMLAALLAGCASDNSGGASSPSASASPTASAPAQAETASASPSPGEDNGAALLADFKAKVQAGAAASELGKLLDDSIPQVKPEIADEMIRELLAYYDAHLQDVEKTFEADAVQQNLQSLKWPFTDDQTAGIKDETARKAVEEAVAGGYKLETAEGFVFPVVDYGKLKRFDAHLSAEMKDYIALLAMESDAKTAADGGLVITWDELANRALAAEKYVKDYPESKERQEAAKRYLQYMWDLLIGLDNTPVFEFETFKIDPKVKAEYEKVVAEHPDTVTAQMAQQFLDVLKKTGGAVFKKGKDGQQVDIPEVKAFRDGMQAKILERLGVANPNK
jgi:soluble cytochrome b562